MEIKRKSKTIFKGKYARSIRDFQSEMPIHAHVIPTEYYLNFIDFVKRAAPREKLFFLNAIIKTVEKLGIVGGFNVRIDTGTGPIGVQVAKAPFEVNLVANESVAGARIAYEYNENNPFTGIILGQTDDVIILRNRFAMSFHDKFGRTDTHAQVIPTGRYVNFVHFIKAATRRQKLEFLDAVANTAERLGVSENFNIKFNVGKGPIGRTTVTHMHCHVQAGQNKQK